MKRSRNLRNCDRIGQYSLRPREERRRRLLDVDFLAPREQAITAALAARVMEPVDRIPLAECHFLIARLMLLDGTRKVEASEVCARCGALLEFPLDLEGALHSAEAAAGRAAADPRLRFPTVRDLERAAGPEELVSLCALASIEIAEAERILADADPLASVALSGQCCVCGGEVRTAVDLASRWLAAERRTAAGLLEDIHELARHYHWSERDILALSDSRRRQYIALCRAAQESDAMELNSYV